MQWTRLTAGSTDTHPECRGIAPSRADGHLSNQKVAKKTNKQKERKENKETRKKERKGRKRRKKEKTERNKGGGEGGERESFFRPANIYFWSSDGCGVCQGDGFLVNLD